MFNLLSVMIVKSLLMRNRHLSWYCYILYKKYQTFFMSHGKLSIKRANDNEWGIIKIQKYISGENNKLILGKGCKLYNTKIHIIGNNNQIVFGDNVNIGPKCSFWIEGNNCKIYVGSMSTFTQFVHVNAQEDFSEISIGEDCMFSNHIIIRTSDSHPIYDLDTNERVNFAKSINIGKHVWIAPHSTIMKGSDIGNGAIIGSNTLVTKKIPDNCLAVGLPAKVVKQNIKWTREDIIFKKVSQ